RSATSIWPPATMNSVTPTTRLSQQWRKLPLFARPIELHETPFAGTTLALSPDRSRAVRRLPVRAAGARAGSVVETDPIVARRRRPDGAALPVAMDARTDGAGNRATNGRKCAQ